MGIAALPATGPDASTGTRVHDALDVWFVPHFRATLYDTAAASPVRGLSRGM